MPNTSDRLSSELLGGAIDLAKFEMAERRILLRRFRELERETIKALRDIDPTQPSVSFHRQQRLEKLLLAVRGSITSAYRTMATTLRRDLKDLALVEVQGIQSLVTELTVQSMFSALPSESVVRALVDETILMGRPLSEWWSRQATSFRDRFASTVRAGLLKGDSLNTIVRSLRGTPGARFHDGSLNPSRTSLSTLVRTAIQNVAQEARLATFEKNADVLQGMEFLTSLDDAVCPICRPYSGMAYSLDHEPLPGTKLPYPGPIPLHPNCRCQWLPVLKEYDDLLDAKGPRLTAELETLPEATKRELDGGLGEDLSLPMWLRRQPASRQQRLLGEARWAMWKAGKLPLHAMINAVTQRPYTIEQLKTKRRRRVA